MISCRSFAAAACLLAVAAAAPAVTYVLPMLGGGQTVGDMYHVNIAYDEANNVMSVTFASAYDPPVLRPLGPDLAFDPTKSYSALNGQAYNAQYGWNPGGFFHIPSGAGIWVQEMSQTPGLECYSGSGTTGSYSGLFGTTDPVTGIVSDTKWKWSGYMLHNTYVVEKPGLSSYETQYHIYFGDAATGSRANYMQYDDDFITFTWTATPVVLPGDANKDGYVRFADYLLLEQNFGKTGKGWAQGDFTGDGCVKFADYLLLEQNFGKSMGVPEPASLSLLLLLAPALVRRR